MCLELRRSLDFGYLNIARHRLNKCFKFRQNLKTCAGIKSERVARVIRELSITIQRKELYENEFCILQGEIMELPDFFSVLISQPEVVCSAFRSLKSTIERR